MNNYFVFECSPDLYAITNDATGSNLPSDRCKAGWRFLRTITLSKGEKHRIVLNVTEALADIAAKGYHLVDGVTIQVTEEWHRPPGA